MLAVAACLVGIGVMGGIMGKKIVDGNTEVQRSIDHATVTDVVLDGSGMPHLTSKDSGEDIVSLTGIHNPCLLICKFI